MAPTLPSGRRRTRRHESAVIMGEYAAGSDHVVSTYGQEQPFYPSPQPGPYAYPPPGTAPFPPYPLTHAQQVWSPQPAPRGRRRTARLVALIVGAVAVVAVAGVAVWAVAGRGGGSAANGRLALPATFAGYTQLHNELSDRVETAIREFAKTAGAGDVIGADATIGSYSHNTGDQPVLVAVVLPTSTVGSSAGGSPTAVVDDMMMGTGAVTRAFAPGPHGGAVSCGVATFGIAKETMCAWADTRLAGILYSINEGKSPQDIAAVTQQFRARIE